MKLLGISSRINHPQYGKGVITNVSSTEFKDEFYGKTGTEKRNKLEKGYEQFKFGALIHEARIEIVCSEHCFGLRIAVDIL